MDHPLKSFPPPPLASEPTSSGQESSSEEPTFEPLSDQESKPETKVIITPENITPLQLGKLRMEYPELNEQLYTLETKRAKGEISLEDFKSQKQGLIAKYL
jgi:hypothetical protein